MPQMHQRPIDPCLESLEKQVNCLTEDLSSAKEAIVKLSERVPYLDSDVEVQKDHLLEAAAFALAHSDSTLTAVQNQILIGLAIIGAAIAVVIGLSQLWERTARKADVEKAVDDAAEKAREATKEAVTKAVGEARIEFANSIQEEDSFLKILMNSSGFKNAVQNLVDEDKVKSEAYLKQALPSLISKREYRDNLKNIIDGADLDSKKKQTGKKPKAKGKVSKAKSKTSKAKSKASKANKTDKNS